MSLNLLPGTLAPPAAVELPALPALRGTALDSALANRCSDCVNPGCLHEKLLPQAGRYTEFLNLRGQKQEDMLWALEKAKPFGIPGRQCTVEAASAHCHAGLAILQWKLFGTPDYDGSSGL